MQAILVPTDFSPVAQQATLYAFELAKQLQVKEVVLYHAYQAPVNIDPMVAPVILPDIETLKESSEYAMKQFRHVVSPFCDKQIQLKTELRYDHLGAGLDEVCAACNAGLIVMGVTGAGKLEQTIFGSNALSVARNGTVPVILVPPHAHCTEIKEVMLACDLKEVVSSTPVQPIRNILEITKAQLFVLHVNKENKPFTAAASAESLMLDTLLQDYNPIYHFEEGNDFVEVVNKVALERMVDLLVVIPKKQGLFAGLFHTSATKQLAYHSHIPIMVVHE